MCAAGIGGGSRGPGGISGAGGLLGASVVAVGAVLLLLLSLLSGIGVMLLLWLHSGLFAVVCVALFPPPQCAFGVSCRGWLLGALFVCSCYYIVGPRSWASFSSWSVPFGVSCRCLRCYTFSHKCVTKRRSSWACIDNLNPDQETIKGTHAQETSANQRRPTTQHAAQGSNPPIGARLFKWRVLAQC